ncbi:Cytochrome c-type biogenesis protein CcmE, heme chaperone [hydrothermal vent metagenome]|uniref:Cytochrome c-type biogenesis protein CcmE, heme chaperone n=1 Tax=hydrothermal vent metagenome TaxID=652676 RepID=A0A3B0WIB8_9ZZZZ
MNKRSRRKVLVLAIIFGVATATVLGLTAFEENLLYFYSPTQVKSGDAPQGHTFRVGGLVVDGSVRRAPDSLKVEFDVTDNEESMTVEYTGILPDLFREGQGIVAMGSFGSNGQFIADEVLAKHDEKYMPPEVAAALQAAEDAAKSKAQNKLTGNI